jgi:hypothetical protein
LEKPARPSYAADGWTDDVTAEGRRDLFEFLGRAVANSLNTLLKPAWDEDYEKAGFAGEIAPAVAGTLH